MILYHGSSDAGISEFDLNHNKTWKTFDFGKGLYLTTNFQQAVEWSCYHRSRGAVYEFEINIEELNHLDLTNTEDFYYILCLCRSDLEEIAPDFDGYDKADIISGLLLDGSTEDFEKIAMSFLQGDISYDDLVVKTQIFDKDRNQYCVKTEFGLSVINDGFRKKYCTHREKDKIIVVEV